MTCFYLVHFTWLKCIYFIQVNYYLRTQSAEDTKDFSYKRSIRFHGQVNSGIVIGLDQDTYYYVEAQVFTDAGLGPLGERNLAETMNPGITIQSQDGFKVVINKKMHGVLEFPPRCYKYSLHIVKDYMYLY